MKSLRFLFFIAFTWASCLTCYAAAPQADWTILVYAQTNNTLNSFAYKSFNDMASVATGKNCNTLVQWHKSGERGTLRYKIEKGAMALDQCISTPTDGNKAEDLVGAMRWAVEKYPAKKYCLVLWNHGIGILDPVWGNTTLSMNQRFVWDNPRIQIEDLTFGAQEKSLLASNNEDDEILYQAALYRGILFNEHSRTYMNNQVLTKALSEIKKKVLKNKKIDILGMDACLMAMVEVGYQVKDFASYMVGSQEVELAYGWNYKPLLQSMMSGVLSPLQAAQSIVVSYEEMYKTQIQFYTQSAVDLNKFSVLKDSIDNVVSNMFACYNLDKKGFSGLVKNARSRCLRFSTPTYIDLHSFLQELSSQVSLLYEKKNGVKRAFKLKKNVKSLQLSLKVGQAALTDTVVAHAAGKYYPRAKGLSIYYPMRNINSSYARTDFAKDSLWHEFLRRVAYW